MAIQKTNSLAINSVKNLAQFAVGFGLTVATFGYVFDLQRVVLAALSLLFIYLASYLYNDITDLAEDKKDPFKLKFKPLARGELKVETAKKLMGVLYALGFALAFFLGQEFFPSAHAWMLRIWKLSPTAQGVIIFKHIPWTEMLWGLSWGLVWGPMYEFLVGARTITFSKK